MPTLAPRNYNCPRCGAEIDHLWYSADVTNWGYETGSCDMEGDNWQYDGDCETHDSQTDEVRYECPDCGAEIGPRSTWDTDNTPVPPDPATLVQDLEEHPTGPLYISKMARENVRIYKCVDCGIARQLDPEEDTVICHNCEHEHVVDASNTVIY